LRIKGALQLLLRCPRDLPKSQRNIEEGTVICPHPPTASSDSPKVCARRAERKLVGSQASGEDADISGYLSSSYLRSKEYMEYEII